MAEYQMKNRQGLPSEAKGATQPTSAERDTTIMRLERALAEERQHALTLVKRVEELLFKAGILEKSYANQLEDARQRSEKAEAELEELTARMAELEAAHEDALRALAKTRNNVERSPITSPQTDGVEAPSQVEFDGSLTINKLMSDTNWEDDDKLARTEKEPETSSDEELPNEELISPEVVLKKAHR